MFRDLKPVSPGFTGSFTEIFHPGIQESFVYKTNIQYKDKAFSSLTYFNELNDSVFKIVLLTTFGNTLLEAEISKQDFKVNNVISYLNRKPILSLLEKDWRIVLKSNFSNEAPEIFSSSGDEQVFVYGKGRKNILYYYSESKKSVTKVEAYSGRKVKTLITVNSSFDHKPETITIAHPAFHLQMKMNLLKKVNNESAE